MTVRLVRIDDRLIHGQVIQGCIPAFKINKVLLVSSEIASDVFRQDFMKLALPAGVSMQVLAEKEAAKELKNENENGNNTLVLAAGPSEIVELLKDGVNFDKVILGGMHHKEGARQMGNTLFVTENELFDLKYLMDEGVEISVQSVPGTRSVNLKDLIN